MFLFTFNTMSQRQWNCIWGLKITRSVNAPVTTLNTFQNLPVEKNHPAVVAYIAMHDGPEGIEHSDQYNTTRNGI